MKLVQKNSVEKHWGITPKNTSEGIEIWAIDSDNSSKHIVRILIIRNNGVWEREKEVRETFMTQGYDPFENGFTYLDDGAIETSRDKTRKMEEAIARMGKLMILPLIFPFVRKRKNSKSLSSGRSGKKHKDEMEERQLIEYSPVG